MKFITESDLRDLFKEHPFARYAPESGTKITPGARQFLMDRGIRLEDPLPGGLSLQESKKKTEESVRARKNPNSLQRSRIFRRLASTEALLLSVAQALLERDVQIAQQVIELSRALDEVKTALESGMAPPSLPCAACSGICGKNASEDLGDCFPITGFHIQLEKGKEIILLHRLRCVLREMVLELSDYEEQGSESAWQEASGRIYEIINRLSQMICTASGGKTCRRKI